jgi:hypothetical protein
MFVPAPTPIIDYAGPNKRKATHSFPLEYPRRTLGASRGAPVEGENGAAYAGCAGAADRSNGEWFLEGVKHESASQYDYL